MTNDVFSRYETKYLLDDETYIHIRSKLHSHMVLDQYKCQWQGLYHQQYLLRYAG